MTPIIRISAVICTLIIGIAMSANATDKKPELTPMQQHVIKGGTEPAFKNEYWDNHAEGIYVDIQSGEALFSSTDKFDSGTGWPSFTKPIEKQNIATSVDTLFGLNRTEVKSSGADTHLGHVFNDGPPEKGGHRYCINSAAVRFVPKAEMQAKGYGEYLYLFEK